MTNKSKTNFGSVKRDEPMCVSLLNLMNLLFALAGLFFHFNLAPVFIFFVMNYCSGIQVKYITILLWSCGLKQRQML